MQRKCHRCDKLYTPTSHHTWCQDCIDGKPVKPRKTLQQLKQEREERMAKAYKFTKFCVQCGNKFYTNNPKKIMCGDYECEEQRRNEQLEQFKERKRAERSGRNEN